MQAITSKDTSLNQVSALHKKLVKNNMLDNVETIIDWGGGKYDTTAEYVLENMDEGIFVVVDKFNRTENHNWKSIEWVMEATGGDGAKVITNANVLNVIKEKDQRRMMLSAIKHFLAYNGTAYFSAYKATKSKDYIEEGDVVGQETTKGWQNAQPLSFYVDEIKGLFNQVQIKDGMIIARK